MSEAAEQRTNGIWRDTRNYFGVSLVDCTQNCFMPRGTRHDVQGLSMGRGVQQSSVARSNKHGNKRLFLN